jgi:hypothetical protein
VVRPALFPFRKIRTSAVLYAVFIDVTVLPRGISILKSSSIVHWFKVYTHIRVVRVHMMNTECVKTATV